MNALQYDLINQYHIENYERRRYYTDQYYTENNERKRQALKCERLRCYMLCWMEVVLINYITVLLCLYCHEASKKKGPHFELTQLQTWISTVLLRNVQGPYAATGLFLTIMLQTANTEHFFQWALRLLFGNNLDIAGITIPHYDLLEP